MVFTWLSISLSKDIVDNVLHCDTARENKKYIDERYGQSNASRYYQTQREIVGVSQWSSNIASLIICMSPPNSRVPGPL